MTLNRCQFTRHTIAGSAALVAATFAQMSWAQSGKILLGQSCPLTGAAAQLGIQFNAGANIYFDLLNAKGGVGGGR